VRSTASSTHLKGRPANSAKHDRRRRRRRRKTRSRAERRRQDDVRREDAKGGGAATHPSALAWFPPMAVAFASRAANPSATGGRCISAIVSAPLPPPPTPPVAAAGALDFWPMWTLAQREPTAYTTCTEGEGAYRRQGGGTRERPPPAERGQSCRLRHSNRRAPAAALGSSQTRVDSISTDLKAVLVRHAPLVEALLEKNVLHAAVAVQQHHLRRVARRRQQLFQRLRGGKVEQWRPGVRVTVRWWPGEAEGGTCAGVRRRVEGGHHHSPEPWVRCQPQQPPW